MKSMTMIHIFQEGDTGIAVPQQITIYELRICRPTEEASKRQVRYKHIIINSLLSLQDEQFVVGRYRNIVLIEFQKNTLLEMLADFRRRS